MSIVDLIVEIEHVQCDRHELVQESLCYVNWHVNQHQLHELFAFFIFHLLVVESFFNNFSTKSLQGFLYFSWSPLLFFFFALNGGVFLEDP